MNQDQFKKLLDEAIEPVKKTQKEHSESLKTLDTSVGTLKASVESLESRVKTVESSLEAVKSSVGTLKSTMKNVEFTVESTKSSVVTMEGKITIYGDMYQANNGNARKLEKRVESLEQNAGIEPSPELTLTGVQ